MTMQKVWLCTHVCWALAIHHRTLVSFHFIFQKRSLLYSNSSANLPWKPSPHTPLLHHEYPSQTTLSFECWNPKLFFEKPYPILIFKIFPLSQIPLNQLFPIPLNQMFPKPPQKTLPESTSPFIVESPNSYQFFEKS